MSLRLLAVGTALAAFACAAPPLRWEARESGKLGFAPDGRVVAWFSHDNGVPRYQRLRYDRRGRVVSQLTRTEEPSPFVYYACEKTYSNGDCERVERESQPQRVVVFSEQLDRYAYDARNRVVRRDTRASRYSLDLLGRRPVGRERMLVDPVGCGRDVKRARFEWEWGDDAPLHECQTVPVPRSPRCSDASSEWLWLTTLSQGLVPERSFSPQPPGR